MKKMKEQKEWRLRPRRARRAREREDKEEVEWRRTKDEEVGGTGGKTRRRKKGLRGREKTSKK